MKLLLIFAFFLHDCSYALLKSMPTNTSVRNRRFGATNAKRTAVLSQSSIFGQCDMLRNPVSDLQAENSSSNHNNVDDELATSADDNETESLRAIIESSRPSQIEVFKEVNVVQARLS
jgi:hypothetical protein